MDPPIHGEPTSATPPHAEPIAMTTIGDPAPEFASATEAFPKFATEPATQTTPTPATEPVNSSSRMLVLVGFPGSGKTTFSNQLCHVREDWRRVNQEDMGDRQTCEAYAKEYLGQGLKVVIDHCNFDESQRKVWVQLAWRLDVPVDCILFDTTQEECTTRISARKKNPTDVIGTNGVEIPSHFISNFRPPTSAEGFERIGRLSPRPTPEYNSAALNEVFAMLDAQPRVEHKRKAESPDYDKLRGVLRALPTMSRRIVDDTVHEKVLSYLDSHAAAGDGMRMVTWGALEVVKECLAPGKDHRVASVAVRLVGRLAGEGNVFHELKRGEPEVLQYVVKGYQGDEGLLRCSCVDAIRGFIGSEEGALWFLETGQAPIIITSGLQDPSTYVVAATCKLLVTIIDADGTSAHASTLHSLLASLDLVNLIDGMLHSEGAEDHRLAAMEFFWRMADARTKEIETFVRETGMLRVLPALLRDPNRLVRGRALEVMSVVLEWAPDPLAVLVEPGIMRDTDPIPAAYNYITNTIIRYLSNDSFDSVQTAVGLLNTALKLVNRSVAQRSEWSNDIAALAVKLLSLVGGWANTQGVVVEGEMVRRMEEEGIEGKIKAFFDGNNRAKMLRKTFVLAVLKIIHSVAISFPEAYSVSTALDPILAILMDGTLCADQRLLKVALAALPPVLAVRLSIDEQKEGVVDEGLHKAAKTLTTLLQDPDMECRGVTLLLEAFEAFLGNDALGSLVCEQPIADNLAEALNLKLYDVGWDVRDSVLEFIGRLFAKGDQSYPGVEFAIRYNLPSVVLDKLTDSEAYVRASCLNAFQAIVKHPRGWDHILAQGLHLATHLPTLVQDSEAFVRRAAFEVMLCLVRDRAYGAVMMETGAEVVSPAVMVKIMDDSDWEVRIRGCQFLEALWDCGAGELVLNKRRRRESMDTEADEMEGVSYSADELDVGSVWFYQLNGDRLLIEATQDSARLVRHSVLVILRHILVSLSSATFTSPSPSIPQKRAQDNRLSARDSTFLRCIQQIDFDRLEASASVEHLYQEAMDIDREVDEEMMRGGEESGEGGRSGGEESMDEEGGNSLDCE